MAICDRCLCVAVSLILYTCQLLTVGQIDFDVVQAVTNYKNVNITKAMFRRALAKLKGNAGSSKGKTAMAGSKPKGVAKKTTPSKGGRGRKNKAFSDNAILDENLVEGPGEGPSHDADADIVTGEVEDGGQFSTSY